MIPLRHARCYAVPRGSLAISGTDRQVLKVEALGSGAAVGPVVAAELESIGVQVNIMPRDNTFFMKPLVRELTIALMKDK